MNTTADIDSSVSRESAAGNFSDTAQFLTFSLGQETLGLNILTIKEIIEYGRLTAVPQMPRFIEGVINLRGRVVPVVNLALRMGKSPTPPQKRTCIVIIEVANGSNSQDVGVVVDSVSEVLDIPANRIEPAPAFGARLRTDFIRGMAKVGDTFVILVNADKVLSIDQMASIASGINGHLELAEGSAN